MDRQLSLGYLLLLVVQGPKQTGISAHPTLYSPVGWTLNRSQMHMPLGRGDNYIYTDTDSNEEYETQGPNSVRH